MPAGDAQAALQQALRDAQAAVAASDAALKAGDFAAYGTAQKRLSEAIQRALAAEAQINRGGAAAARATPSPTR